MKLYRFIWMLFLIVSMHETVMARVRPTGSRIWDFEREIVEQAADFLVEQTQIPFTITQPGVYRLAEPLTLIGGTIITINASDVVLDLNGKSLTGDTIAITVNATVSNIIIGNGFIIGSPFQTGISIQPLCSNITLEDLELLNFAIGSAGISATSASDIVLRRCFVTKGSGDAVTMTLCNDVIVENSNFYNNSQYGLDLIQSYDCSISGCKMGLNNVAGMRLNLSHNIVVEDCVAYDNSTVGFELIQSNTNYFQQCKAMSNGGITGTGSIMEAGFLSLNGIGNIFEHCIANGTTTTATNAASQVAGFALLGSEKCSKIIKCEGGNTTSPASGSAVPYGILLNSTLDTLSTVAAALLDNNATQFIQTTAWHPNSQLFAVGGLTGAGGANRLQLFEYNRTLQQLVLHFSAASFTSVFSVAWSPNGNFLAVGGNMTGGISLTVFSLDRINKTLTQLAGCNISAGSSSVFSIEWTSDGQFLGVGVDNNLLVYKFDTTALTLTQVSSVALADVTGVSWSSDGNYLAASTGAGSLFVYAFNKSIGSNTLTLVSTQSHGAALNSVAWSRDGNFLLVGGGVGTGGNTIRVYQFNKQMQTLSLVSSLVMVNSVLTVAWSPNDQYIAAGGNGAGGTGSLFIFLFDRNVNQLELVESIMPGNTIQSVSWSRDGRYILFGGVVFTGSVSFKIVNALKFPTNNMVLNNKVYCNEGNQYPGGVGISGSSIQNLIIGNTAYQNTFNYEFVTNTFLNGLDGAPTLLQNVSIPPFDEP